MPMRTRSWPSEAWLSLIGFVLADELEQLAVSATAALLGRACRVLARVAHQGAQALQVGAGVQGREARGRRVVGDQLGAPALCLVQGERVACAAKLALKHRGARELDVGRSHELADELHLAPARFVALDAPAGADRLDERFAEAERREVVVAELEQRFAERLQVMRLLLAPRLARPLAQAASGARGRLIRGEGRVAIGRTLGHRQ